LTGKATNERCSTSDYRKSKKNPEKMGRLKGISPLLSPDLLHTLSSMGHGDELGNFLNRKYVKNTMFLPFNNGEEKKRRHLPVHSRIW